MNIDKAVGSPYGTLKKLRARSVTITWAVLALIATAGWIYLIALAIWFIVRWLVG